MEAELWKLVSSVSSNTSIEKTNPPECFTFILSGSSSSSLFLLQSFDIMPRNGKKQLLPPSDVLSNLPDSVIDDILTRLPLRNVVSTSILLKKWRYNWCRLPQLKLDQTLWKTTEDLMSPTIGFTIILCRLFAVHAGPITKFTLDIPDLITCPTIDHLIYFLSRNGIQHLVLKFPLGNPYKLPSSFFISSSLMHLTLTRCQISPPPIFKGFDRLINLKLRRAIISSESLGSLISHCPLLKNLELTYLDNSNPVEISAHKLKLFVFRGNIHIIHLNNVPLLSNVSYKPKEFSVEAEHDLGKVFEFIPALKNLWWKHDFVHDVHVGPAEVIPTRLPYALNRLKRLNICCITLGEFFDLSFALCLIRSSPNLKEFGIEVVNDVYGYLDGDYDEPVPQDAVDDIPASFLDMTLNYLRTVKIYGVTGAAAEMQLIKVLLAKSPTLVRMVIRPCVMEDKESFKVLAEITKFPRASSEAEVVYSVD
ncbi:hypothetical protein KY285_034785 [Solanum tuberosum]|nr:hypothetical protein KY285_034785 [Solanum tuberosum]